MDIPKSFNLGTRTWRVRFDGSTLPKGTYGMCYPRHETIRVVTRAPKDMTGSFWHEVTHAILYDMEGSIRSPRWDDEAFVTAFSKRLTQVIHTAEF